MVPHVNCAAEGMRIVEVACYAPRASRGVSRKVRAYDYRLHPPGTNAPKARLFVQIKTG